MTIISLDPIHSLTANVNKLQNLANKPCKHLRDELFINHVTLIMGDLSTEWRQDWSLELQFLSLEASCWCESNGIMRVILRSLSQKKYNETLYNVATYWW